MRLKPLGKVRRFLLHGELQFLLRSGIVDLYQPLPWAGIENGPRCAGTMERWAAINQELGSSSGSAMDIGCNLGYFTFQMARRDFFCLGIEKDSLLYHLCNLTKEIYGFEQAVFMKMMVDESSSQKLPSADVTLFLSVLHHVIWRSGMAAATRLLTGILSKTRRVLFFEMGQSNETHVSWAKHLPAMSPDPEVWIEEYLLSLGATRVKLLGRFATHVSPVKRSLFAVYVN